MIPALPIAYVWKSPIATFAAVAQMRSVSAEPEIDEDL